MPNNTRNYVTLRHFSTKKINALKEELKKKDPEIFNHLRPQPPTMFHGNLSEEDRIECKLTGVPNWYDWNCENWGTKWDAYGIDVINGTANTLELQFFTAWDSPIALFNYIYSKGWKVYARYRDEGDMFVGYYKNGENTYIKVFSPFL